MEIKYLNMKNIDIIEIKYYKQIYNIEIHYNCGEDFYTEFWLQNIKYGIKSFMFGIPYKKESKQELIEIAISNIEEHIKNYKEYYED